MKYANLEVIDQNKIGPRRKVLCRCDCGNEKLVSIYSLKNGDTKSCGCLRKQSMKLLAVERFIGKKPFNYVDLSGKKIGLVTIKKRISDRRKHTPTYLCLCECGTEFDQEISVIRKCEYLTCECGYPRHPLRSILRHMRERCENVNNKSYPWYGGNGIKLCEEWNKFPIRFIEWSLKNGWDDKEVSERKHILTIDRIDSNKDYCPENCRWITLSENSSNAMRKRWGV